MMLRQHRGIQLPGPWLSHRILPFVKIWNLCTLYVYNVFPVFDSRNERLDSIFGNIPDRCTRIPFQGFHDTLINNNRAFILTAFLLLLDVQCFVVTFNLITHRWLPDSELFLMSWWESWRFSSCLLKINSLSCFWDYAIFHSFRKTDSKQYTLN